jgi:hypothetical protein
LIGQLEIDRATGLLLSDCCTIDWRCLEAQHLRLFDPDAPRITGRVSLYRDTSSVSAPNDFKEPDPVIGHASEAFLALVDRFSAIAK